MNINKIKRKQNVATLSSVLIITTICLFRVGINRNTFRSRNKRNVLSTEIPELPELPNSSNKLTKTIRPSNKFNGSLM
jgi:hypothetical protein